MVIPSSIALQGAYEPPYYRVYDPLLLLFENHGSLDPSKCGTVDTVSPNMASLRQGRLSLVPSAGAETLPLGQLCYNHNLVVRNTKRIQHPQTYAWHRYVGYPEVPNILSVRFFPIFSKDKKTQQIRTAKKTIQKNLNPRNPFKAW